MRGDDPARSERRVVLVVVAIALLGGIGPAAYYFFWARHEEDRRPEAGARAGTTGAREGEDRAGAARKAVPPEARWDDQDLPSKGRAAPEEPPPRDAVRKTRSLRRHRTRRGPWRASPGSGRAQRPSRLAARPTRQASITMYMAHW